VKFGAVARSVRPVHLGEFRHPRVVPLYDHLWPWGPDDDFFCALAGPVPRRIADVGCGTGRLALGLAGRGHAVAGVDPEPAMLAQARAKPGAGAVSWRLGTAADLDPDAFDLVLLTAHVAQFVLDDRAWADTLGNLHRALVADGRLAFDSRDPAARGWEAWNQLDSWRRVEGPDGPVETWVEVTGVVELADGDVLVRFTHHYRFADGEEARATATLCFRTQAALTTSLSAAGFAVETVHGGFGGEPVGAGAGEFVVVARAEAEGR
jgi:SAM-dependent methyltransferase